MSDDYSKPLRQEYDGLLELINENMDLERWGFVQTYSSITRDTLPFILIYDSQQCRIKFEYYTPDYGGVYHNSRKAQIWYGRLHTLSDSENRFAPGKKTIYWHSIYYDVLKFLAGMSPEEGIYTAREELPILQEFKKSNLNQILPSERQFASVILDLRLHNRIWKYYEKNFFDIFDVRNPAVWEKYVIFHNETQRLLYENRKRQAKIETPLKQFDDFVPDELW